MIRNTALVEKRERAFLVLAGIFLCAMTMLNIIGITRFVQLGPLALAVGVLPYPVTFLCTDLISEIYGRSRANFLVTVGLGLNFFILGVMWLGYALPAVPAPSQPPWQLLHLSKPVHLPSGSLVETQIELYHLLFATTSGAVFASMIAYIAAQYCDVYLFHFWRELTKGKHLWLRNNGSTIISQLVDSFMVISITFGASFLAGKITLAALFALLWSNYIFKLVSALLDTPFFYLGVYYLKRYLEIEKKSL